MTLPVVQAFRDLARSFNRAEIVKQRVAAQGGDIEGALGDVQEIEIEASRCFTLVKVPEHKRARR